MAFRFHVLVIAGLLFGSAAARAVEADTLTVRSGDAGVNWEDPPFFHLHGDGFELFSGFFSVPLSAQQTCFTGCAPGTLVDLGAIFGGGTTNNLGQSQIAVVDGTTFATQSDPTSWLQLTGQFSFRASDVVVPALTSDPDQFTVFLMAPFTFDGRVAGARPREGSPLFLADLTGRGTASLRLVNSDGLWRFPEVSYSFEDQAPIPEPTSLLLLGSGLAGLLMRAKTHRD